MPNLTGTIPAGLDSDDCERFCCGSYCDKTICEEAHLPRMRSYFFVKLLAIFLTGLGCTGSAWALPQTSRTSEQIIEVFSKASRIENESVWQDLTRRSSQDHLRVVLNDYRDQVVTVLREYFAHSRKELAESGTHYADSKIPFFDVDISGRLRFDEKKWSDAYLGRTQLSREELYDLALHIQVLAMVGAIEFSRLEGEQVALATGDEQVKQERRVYAGFAKSTAALVMSMVVLKFVPLEVAQRVFPIVMFSYIGYFVTKVLNIAGSIRKRDRLRSSIGQMKDMQLPTGLKKLFFMNQLMTLVLREHQIEPPQIISDEFKGALSREENSLLCKELVP